MKKSNFYSCLMLTMLLFSCTSTKITSIWREPGKHLHEGEWNKILVVALLKDETSRRKVEDEMINYMKGKGIVSYNYLNETYNKINVENLRKKIKDDGFDGAVSMRLIDVDKEKTYISGHVNLYPEYYRGFSGYYQRNLVYYTTPGYFVVSKSFIVETIVYSIKDDKIIWSGITETFDPDGLENMTREISKVIYKQMIDEGFVQKK